MAKKLGTIKSISGSAEVIAVDKSGNQRVLKVGDSLYEGETVKTTSADSKVVIATNNGKELSMIGEDTLNLDPKATAADSQVAALQKALLNGANLEDLEETAAGGTSGGRAGDGMSLGETRFEHGGHYSNINASTSAINPLGAASFAGPAEGKSGGLDSGRGGDDGFYIDTTPPSVIIDGITPVDTNNPADGNPDKGIVKGHSDEPNAPVVVTDKDGKIIGTGTTDDKGNFEITTDPIKPGDKVNVEVTDKAGNKGNGEGTAGDTTYVDTTAPKVEVDQVTPVDTNNPADGNPDKGIVKGHSDEPNAPVVVTDKDGKIIGTGTTDDKGNFEITTDPIKPGDKVNVEVTDKAGNKGNGEGTAGDTTYVDTTAPKVEVDQVTPVDTNNPADGNPDKGIVKGHSDEPNAPVVVTDKDGKIIGTGTTDDKGNFEITTDPIKPGDKVNVEVTDKAGNKGNGEGTAGDTTYVDTTAPKVEVDQVTPVDTNNPADGNPDKGIVKGHSDEPNAPVVVTDKDGKIIGTGTTDDKGNFEITTDPIKPGDKVNVEVTDKAGNKGNGEGTAGDTTYVDTTAPKVEVDQVTPVDTNNPADGNPDKGIVKGHSDEPNAPVVVTDKDGKIIGTGTTDDKGNFEITTDPIKPGDKVNVEVTDKAGNKGNGEGTAGDTTYVDTTAPKVEVDQVTPVDTNNPADGNPDKGIVKGHSDEPNAPVVVTDKDGKIIGTGTTDDKGNFEITTDPIKPGDKVNVEVTDKAGNKGNGEGTAGDTTYVDTTAPKVEVDQVTPVDTNNPADGNPDKGIVKGHSDEPNAPVVVTDKDGKIIGTGTTDDKGNFEITTDPIKPGDKVNVEVTDKAGNKGNGEGTAGDTTYVDTTAPKVEVDQVTPVDTNNPADGNPDKGIVKGHSDEPNAPVVVTDKDGKIIGTGTTDDKGNFEITTDPIKPGDKVNVEVTDKAGNKGNGEGTAGDTTYVDTTAPKVEVDQVTPVDTNNPADGNPDKGIVKGHSDEPNAPVVVTDKDGKIIGTGTTDDKGNFEITTDPIKPGDKVNVEVTDKAGNKGNGEGTAGDTTYVDTTAPKVEVDQVTPVDTNNPADGNPDKGIVKGHSDEPNAPVVVTDKDGKIIGTGTTDDKGNFEITTDPIKPGDKVNVEVTDKAGNKGNGEGTAGDTTYVDTTAPKVEVDQVTPVDTNNPADGNPDKGIVKGHSDEPNAPVVVTDKDGKIIGTGTTDDKGNFEITTDPIKPGDKVNVEVTDKAGNKGNGEGTAGDMDFNDNVAPDAPVITEVTDNAYGGIENGGNVLGINDGFTNDNTPTFKGTAEPNTTIVLKNGNDVIGKDIIVKADGSWEFTPKTPLADGEYNVVAIATDKAGNVSVPSNIATINIDTHVTTPVITEIIDDVAGGIVNGDVKNGLTNDNTPTLKGTAEPFATVKIMIDGKGKYAYVGGELINEWNVKADANGNWEFTTPKLSDGSHTFKVQTTDRAGNNSPESSVVSVNVDTTIGNPKVRFVEDTDGNGVLSVAEVAAIKDGKAHWVIDIPTDGSVKAGDVIQSIDGKGNWVKFVEITDEMIKDGKFEATFNVDINKLKDGKYETPEYRFADEAGNVSESSKASLTLDSEFSRQPSNPSITFPEDNDPKDGKISDKENKAGDNDAGKTTAEISIPKDGSVKPGDKLVVTDENGKQTEKTIEQGDIDNGNIKVPVDLNPGKDNTITAEIINPNNPNNPGKGKGVIGEDSENTKAPEAPVITEVIDDVKGGKFNEDVKGGLTNDSTPTIKGTAKAGSKVEIYDDGNKIGETIAKPDGSWEFTTPELTKQGEHKFTATAENTFGKSGLSNEATIDLDTIAPVIKEVAITPIDTAAKADDTAEATLIVGVTDTPHATVIAKDKDGNFLGRADANDKGGFVIDAKPVNPGDKVVFEVTDKAGNTSESEFKAGDLTHPNDHTAPKVDIDTVTPVDETNPSDGTPDKGIVKGHSDEPNAPVVVTDENGKTIGTGTTDDKGNFDITTSPIKPGDKVTVEVTDKAGNKGKDTETAGDMDIIHKDLPETPVITDVIDDVKGYGEDTKVGNVLDVEGHLTNDKTPTIKGTAKAGSTVVIYDNGVEIGKIENADANWEFTTPVLTKQGEHKFTATAENKFGKSAPSNEATIDLDSIAPKLDNVKITPIDNNSKADNTADITMGTGHTDTPNAEILFRDENNNIIGKGHANSTGDFLIQLDKAVQPGTPVFVQAIDKAGNAGTDRVVASDMEHPNDHTAPSEPAITFVEDVNPKDGKLNKAENSSDGDNANTTAKISVPTDAVVGDVIKYTVNGGTEQSHTISVADKNVGHVEIKVPVTDGQTSSVTAKIVDQAGNASKEVSSSIDSDFTAPNVKITGIIDNVEGGVYKGNVAGTNTNDNKPTIKGTADANQEVVLYDNNKEMGRVTADKDGNWEFKPSDYKEPLADLVGRVHVIKAVVTDAAGNTSEATSALEVDTTIGAPKVSIKEDADHNGVLSVEEAKNLKDSKIHWEVEIPKDGTVSAGDVLQVLGKDGKWKTEKVLSNDDLGKSFEYEATLSGKHFESPSYRIVDLVGNQSTAIHANVQLDSEFSRQPSNPSITFPEDNDPKDGKISDKENKAGDNDAGKTTAEISIPKDGSVKPGDKLVVTDENGKQTEKTIEQGDIDNGNIKVPVDLNPGKDNTITAEIINPNNPNNPGKGKGVIGEDSENTKAPEAPVITEVIDDVKGGKFNEDVKGGLTNDSTPTIKGTAKAGSKVEIYDDGNKIGETIAKPDGSWEFTTPELTKQGEHKFTATAENTFGKSTPSNEVTIDLDTKTEKPVIKEIIDNVEGDTGDISSKNNWTNDNTPTLKGSAEAGAIVDIYVDGRKAGSVEANDKGEWEYTTGKLSDGDHRFYVEATDKAGNAKESDVEAIKVDTNPGQVVITSVTDDNGVDALNGAYDGATTDNTPTINGFAEPYSTVTVSVKDSNGKVVWSGEVYVTDEHGDWSITLDKPLNDGDYTIEASMQDYVKNPVQNSNVVSLTVDTATDIPEIKEIVDDVAGGIVNGDVKNGLTNDNTPTLKGSAEAGADIKVFIDGKIAGTTKAGFDGSWEFTPRTKLSDGEHKFVVEATDKLGHSAKSVEASVDVDTTIGEPKIKFVEDINGDGKLSTNELPAVGLTDGKLHWVVEIPKDGTVKAGDTLQVYGTDGKWKDVVTLSDADIKEGSFTSSDFSKNISEMGRGFVSQPYRFVDPAGNESRGILESIKLDATAPKAPVITDAIDDVKGGKFNENVLGVNKGLTNDNTPTIKGTAEANAKVEIYDNGNKIGETRADSDGKWSFTPNGSVTLPDGEHSITAVAVNVIGRSPVSAEAKLMVDTVTPKPTIDAIIDNKEGGKFHEDVRDDVTNDNRPTFKGSAEANATVELFDNGKSMGTTKANDKGEWTLRPAEPMPDGKHEIVAKATDLAGNENWSKGAYSKVDTDAGTVEITAVIDDVKGGKFNENVLGVDGGLTNDSTPTIKGTAKAGSRVEIYDNDKYIGSTIADSDNGTWTFTTPTLTEQGEHKFTAKAINQNGTTNPSNVAKIILDTDIDIKLTEVTPIAEGTTPGAHISTPTIIMNTISRGNHIPTTTGDDYVKVKDWVSNRANINLCDGNDTLAIGGLVENGVVINAGRGNDKVTIGKYLKESFVNLGEGGANIVRTRIAGISDEINAAFIIKDKNGLKIGDGKTDADGKFDMFIDKAIKPGEKLSVEIVDAAGNKASDSKAASHIEVSGVRYYDNELDVGTNIHAATVLAGNGNDLVVVGEKGKPDGYITANSKIDLGEGDNEIRVRTNIDHSEIKTGSGDDIVTTGLKGNGFGYITNESKIDLGDGNNTLNVRTNIDHSEIKTGSGDDIVNVGVNGIDGYITGHSKVELGAGNDLLNIRTNIDCSTVDTGTGNDVVKVGGYIHGSKVNLGAGDDTLSIGKVDLNNSKVDGGTGYDKLVLENPDKSVNLSDISKFAKNFEELDISGAKNTTLKVGIKDVLDMTDDKNTLKITGDKGDTVDLKGNGWHQGASEDGYTTYTNNTVTIQIKDEIHVI